MLKFITFQTQHSGRKGAGAGNICTSAQSQGATCPSSLSLLPAPPRSSLLAPEAWAASVPAASQHRAATRGLQLPCRMTGVLGEGVD